VSSSSLRQALLPPSSPKWEELDFQSLMAIRRAISDGFGSLLQFFRDCDSLDIRLGSTRRFPWDSSQQRDLDHVFLAGFRALGTFLRVETQEHRDKLAAAVPSLLNISERVDPVDDEKAAFSSSSLPSYQILGYLVPGLLEAVEEDGEDDNDDDAKGNSSSSSKSKEIVEALLCHEGISRFLALIVSVMVPPPSSPTTGSHVNMVEVCLSGLLVRQLLEKAGPQASAYAIDEIAPHLPALLAGLQRHFLRPSPLPHIQTPHEDKETFINEARTHLCILFVRASQLMGPQSLQQALKKHASTKSISSPKSAEEAWDVVVRSLLQPGERGGDGEKNGVGSSPQQQRHFASLLVRGGILRDGLEGLKMCLREHKALGKVLNPARRRRMQVLDALLAKADAE